MHAAASVLSVEDNDADFYLVQAGLERCLKESLELRRASDGREAIALLKRIGNDVNLDIILLDINMPGMDGFGVLRFLKSQPSTQDIPVVVFTSSQRRVTRSKRWHLERKSSSRNPGRLMK